MSVVRERRDQDVPNVLKPLAGDPTDITCAVVLLRKEPKLAGPRIHGLELLRDIG